MWRRMFFVIHVLAALFGFVLAAYTISLGQIFWAIYFALITFGNGAMAIWLQEWIF